jgi:hypothetical protein
VLILVSPFVAAQHTNITVASSSSAWQTSFVKF